MNIPWTLILAGLATVALPVFLMAVAEDGSASGWVEQKGRRVALKYAFAAVSEDILEAGKEKFEVLLSDKPVPPELRKATEAWSAWAGGEAGKGELHGIILYITKAPKTWRGGQVLTDHGLMFFTESVSSPELSNLVFAPAVAGQGMLAGRVSMKKPNAGAEEGDGTWRVEAEFRTPVIERAAVTANLTGAAALASGPYKAVQAYLQACQKKDLEAIKRATSSGVLPALMEMVARSKNDVLDMLAGEAAETAKLKLTKVTVRGDTAEVEFGGGKEVPHTVLENGVWKVGN